MLRGSSLCVQYTFISEVTAAGSKVKFDSSLASASKINNSASKKKTPVRQVQGEDSSLEATVKVYESLLLFGSLISFNFFYSFFRLPNHFSGLSMLFLRSN